MYRLTKPLLLAALMSCMHGTLAQGFANVGRVATPAEIAAWDIDVRPDFKGLPPGSGTGLKGQQVWGVSNIIPWGQLITLDIY